MIINSYRKVKVINNKFVHIRTYLMASHMTEHYPPCEKLNCNKKAVMAALPGSRTINVKFCHEHAFCPSCALERSSGLPDDRHLTDTLCTQHENPTKSAVKR